MGAGVYISYPFCAQKCTYCNFASGVMPASLERDYIQALQAEIASHSWNVPVDTVYFGGGTPSQMDAEALGGLLRGCPGEAWPEATLEAAPGTLTPGKCRAWLDAGINRVSFGVQSFVGRELAKTGRMHTADVVSNEIQMLREVGIGNISVDLIAGLPGQNRGSWAESLDWVEKLEVPHVSVYMLEIDEDSRLGQEVLLNGKRYGAPDVPSDDLIAELYETAVTRLRQAGLERYEISNFARPGSESLHNLKYWRLEPYAGFGADAHSFDGRMRYQNVESAPEYVERWRRNESPRLTETPADQDEERFFVGLRLSEGVEPALDEWDRWRVPIERFVSGGLLETRGSHLRLTDRGVLLSNEVFAEFIA